MTPLDKLAGRGPQIFAAGDRKLEEARRQWQLRCQEAVRNLLPGPAEMACDALALSLN
jgi:hypothetical protein